ncbi:MAG: HAD hydrolase-like protein [Clostridia bacterium]|nr:HAD hydrolase-like protein [Clostridia bacterium]
MNILFDLEGTLIDSKKLQIEVLERVFKRFGVDTKNINMITLIGPPLINTFTKYFGRENAQNAMVFYRYTFQNMQIKNINTFEQIKEILPILKEKGYKLFTTSLQILEVVKRELEHLDLLQYFDEIAGDCPATPFTAKTEIVANVIKKFGLEKERTVFVGDTEFDAQSAEENGIGFIQVAWGYGDKKDCVNTAEELLRAIEK